MLLEKTNELVKIRSSTDYDIEIANELINKIIEITHSITKDLQAEFVLIDIITTMQIENTYSDFEIE